MSLVSDSPLGCSVIPHVFAIAKLATSPKWKVIFADIEAQFKERKEDLALSLRTYISVQITSAHEELIKLNEKVALLLDNVQSAEEKKLVEFLRQNGGIEKVMKSPELMKRLFETQSSEASGEKGMTLADFEQDVKSLLEDKMEELKKVFRESLREANAKMDILIRAIRSGPHDEIIDKVLCIACSFGHIHANCSSIQDIYKIWTKMVRTLIFLLEYTDTLRMPQCWTSEPTVARFVNAVIDHYFRSNNHYWSGEATNPSEALPNSPGETASHVGATTASTPLWTPAKCPFPCQYITAEMFQSVVGAVDDDKSSTVTPEEVNAFMKSKPKAWR